MPVNELKEGELFFYSFEFVVVDKDAFDLYVNSSPMMCVSICAHLSQSHVNVYDLEIFHQNIIIVCFRGAA